MKSPKHPLKPGTRVWVEGTAQQYPFDDTLRDTGTITHHFPRTQLYEIWLHTLKTAIVFPAALLTRLKP